MNETNPPSPTCGFKNFAEVKKAFGTLKPPITEEMRGGFIQGIAQSPQSKQFAFRLLASLLTNQAGRKEKMLTFLQPDLVGLLARNCPPSEGSRNLSDIEAVEEWVRGQFPDFREKAEFTRYLSEENHLWTLYHVLRMLPDTARFIAGLTTFGTCLRKFSLAAAGRKQSPVMAPAKFAVVPAVLLKRIPSRPTALESLLEYLRVCEAWASVTEPLQQDLEQAHSRNLSLKEQLEAEKSSLASEQAARQKAEERETQLQSELASAKQSISSLEQSLKIQAGAHEAATQGAAAAVLADIRAKCLPGLENIQSYADRSEPNTQAIIRNVQQLTEFLSKYTSP